MSAMDNGRTQSGLVVTSKIGGTGRPGLVAFVGIVVVGLLVVLGAHAATGAPVTPDQAIRATVTGGIDSLYSATIAGTKGGVASAISDSALTAQRAKVPSTFARYFTGKPLDRYSRQIQAAVSDQLDRGERDIDGGANVTITSLAANGTEASATARAFVWLQSQNIAGGSEPVAQGWWDYNLHLVNTADGWRIDSIDYSPEPGSEP